MSKRSIVIYWSLVGASAWSGCAPAARALSLADFKTCVSIAGSSFGSTCVLDPNPNGAPYVIGSGPGADSGTIDVQRPVFAYGWNVMLQRQNGTANAAFTGPLVRVDPGATGADLFYFTIDGNRSGNPPAGVVHYDGDVVFLDQGGIDSAVLQNSPNVAVRVQGAYVHVAYCTVKNSARYGIWTDSGSTDSFLIFDNTFVDTGANAIIFGGTNSYIGFNQLYRNHRSCPFGSNGGQLLITPESQTVWIDSNIIADGPAFCDAPNNQWWADGMELYGSNLTVRDNVVTNNGGHGIQVGGVHTATISDLYSNASIAMNNRRNNGASGIWIGTVLSPNTNIAVTTIDVGGGQSAGVTFQTSAPGSSVTNACISGNRTPGVSICKGCSVALFRVLNAPCKVAKTRPASQAQLNVEAINHFFSDVQSGETPTNYLFDQMGLSAAGRNLALGASQFLAAQTAAFASQQMEIVQSSMAAGLKAQKFESLLSERTSALMATYNQLDGQLGGEAPLLRNYLLQRSN